jgi:hypothetical protein
VSHKIANRSRGIIDLLDELFIRKLANTFPDALKRPEVVIEDGFDFVCLHLFSFCVGTSLPRAGYLTTQSPYAIIPNE